MVRLGRVITGIFFILGSIGLCYNYLLHSWFSNSMESCLLNSRIFEMFAQESCQDFWVIVAISIILAIIGILLLIKSGDEPVYISGY